jgi:hypothetical protein
MTPDEIHALAARRGAAHSAVRVVNAEWGVRVALPARDRAGVVNPKWSLSGFARAELDGDWIVVTWMNGRETHVPIAWMSMEEPAWRPLALDERERREKSVDGWREQVK